MSDNGHLPRMAACAFLELDAVVDDPIRPRGVDLDGRDEPSNAVLIRRMLGLAWRYRWGCLTALVLQITVVGLGLAALGLVGLGIDVIRYHTGAQTTPFVFGYGFEPPEGWSEMKVVSVIAAVLLAVAVLHAVLLRRAMVLEAKLVQDIIVQLRSDVYNKLQRLSFRFFDANESGSIINRVTTDVQAVRLFVDSVLIEGAMLVLSLLVYVVYMANLHAGLTLACLVTTPVLWAAMVSFSRVVRPAYRRSRRLMDQMVLRVSESVQGVHVVKGFAREQDEIDKFHEANRKVLDQQRWVFWRLSTYTPAITLLTHVNHAVLLGYGGYLVIQDRLPLGGGLIVFAGILHQVSTRVADMTNIANSIQRSLTGAARVFEVLDTTVEITSPSHAVVMPRPAPPVLFDGVVFGYRTGEQVLHDVSFEVGSGQTLAVMGRTGSGKSSLLGLVPRFYDVVDGCVMIGGVDVRDLDVDDVRRGIGVVFQDNFLFSNTIAANIAFGHPEATRGQIEGAAHVAAVHDFIVDLPDGYDTVIGENGVDLSGGQRQRIAIARAVLLDPPVLLLDDPTAGVDPQTELEIIEAMRSATAGRTTIVVTHRLSTLRMADRVMVMDHGRVVDIGTHEHLMRTSDHYRHVAQLQGADGADRALLGLERGAEL